VRIQRGDAVRAKLAELDLSDADIADAVAWARSVVAPPVLVAEPVASYGAVTAKTKPAVRKKAISKNSASKA